MKLRHMLGPERARLLLAEVLPTLDIKEVKTPRDRLKLGKALMSRGGLLEALGTAIKTQAMLHGARDDG
ncbi:hypothetical protein [Polyangium spumosum]|uniref:Uncharacterized protein n=1 Tax=Polyangium spumosum TaxID=889282 RepID=A0A6N7PNC2_9BACT|nr:hypothetical protein [Polyangium spumosum]MRG90391.1 hypothetical protein [Polyangium spumosum]